MTQKIRIILGKLYVKWPVLLCDFLSIPAAWYATYWFRYNMHLLPRMLTTSHSFLSLTLLTLIQVSCFFYFKTYRGLWHFFSLDDVIRILKACFAATILAIPVLYLTNLLAELPRTVFPLYSIILITLLCGCRLGRRVYWDTRVRNQKFSEVKRVLIIGAGMAGEGLARDLKRDKQYQPVGFIDDNLAKKGLEIHGLPVLGTSQHLSKSVQDFYIDLIFIAIPSASSATMRRIVSACEDSKIPFNTLPSLNDLASGRVEVNALRPVNIEDLLGRDQVTLEWERLKAGLTGKRVLVTGGGGSIGSELCRQILALKPKSLAIVENSEFNLYQIEMELRQSFADIPIEVRLISVNDELAINDFFINYIPELVFHAAAYKHVPLLQNQIRVAVINNVLGTQIVAKASVAVNVEKFILISTDKAVNPTNIMGTTKRVAEIYCQNLNNRVRTQFITVRFGNVLGSAGSVVPLFQKQLQSGGPLKVTDPEMRRYFMTIPEASQLILQAMVNGKGGEIFVLDMGEPIKITYLAEQMIRLAGKEPGKDIMIEYTGLRPGEKLFEELFHVSEQLASTKHEKIFKATFRELNWDELSQTMRLIETACDENQKDELLILLKSLVPELNTTHDILKECL